MADPTPSNLPAIRILLVEDSLADAALVRSFLHLASHDLRRDDLIHVEKLEEAIAQINIARPDVVLLDLQLPGSVGVSTFLELKPYVDGIPVVVLTGATSDHLSQSRLAIQHGAQDYLTKDSLDSDRLYRAIQYSIERVHRTRAEFEVASAGFVQEHILARRQTPPPNLDFAAKCEPATSVGGDFFDCVTLPRERVAIALGDVAGHGLGPALMMAETRGVLRGVLHRETDPGNVLCATNSIISSDCARGAFITLFLAILDAGKGRLAFAAAGHEGFLLNQHKQTPERLAGFAPPLGIIPDQAYETGPIMRFDPGDSLFVCTDGITECYSSEKGEFFGMRRTFEALCREPGTCAEALDALFVAARNFRDYATDDMTALLVTNVSS